MVRGARRHANHPNIDTKNKSTRKPKNKDASTHNPNRTGKNGVFQYTGVWSNSGAIEKDGNSLA